MFVREKIEKDEKVMIMIKVMNAEGHRDNICDGADDNDSVLSSVISFDQPTRWKQS